MIRFLLLFLLSFPCFAKEFDHSKNNGGNLILTALVTKHSQYKGSGTITGVGYKVGLSSGEFLLRQIIPNRDDVNTLLSLNAGLRFYLLCSLTLKLGASLNVRKDSVELESFGSYWGVGYVIPHDDKVNFTIEYTRRNHIEDWSLGVLSYF